MAERRQLQFANEEDVIADIERLRRGCERAGQWTLPQVCWHLSKSAEFSMRAGPFPEPTPEQIARRPVLDQVLGGAPLPSGLTALEAFQPPVDCSESEIDRLQEVMKAAKSYPGPFAPHRLFGPLTPDEARKLRLAHCAHHLSHLIPTHKES